MGFELNVEAQLGNPASSFAGPFPLAHKSLDQA